MNISPQSLYKWYADTLRNPKYRWIIIIGTLVYLISPFDIAPDFLPIVGQVDDAIVLTVFLTEISKMFLAFKKEKSVSDNISDDYDTQNNGAKTVNVDAVSVE